uniref:ATP synthase F0 subunit 8 n=1 Tax=Stenamma diecki TaxID=625352 RepID=UPI001FCE14AB|nr:ATP synthase F0 subunit 8 [Stenamma diecki]UNZ99535.1 ATP synthase F0 subunit 8 [Stenamma diecki]
MPQMMPILWLILMTYTIILMIMTVSLIYFSQSYPSSLLSKPIIKFYNWNWKW